jgi:signal transduction histidine kinase
MRLPLRSRFALLAATLVLLVSSLVGLAGYLTLRHSLLSRASATAHTEATRLVGLVDASNSGQGNTVDISDPSLTRQLSTPGLAVEIDRPTGAIIQATPSAISRQMVALPGLTRQRCLMAGSAQVQITSPPAQLACVRVGSPGRPVATIAVAAPLQDALGSLGTLRRSLIIGVLGGTLLTALLSLVLARQALRPIKRIAATAETIRAGDLGQRIRYRRRDELGQLARVLDACFDELEQAIERQRQFGADASHELKTPLAAIRANVELLRGWGATDPTATDATLASLDQASRRASHLVADLLELAKLDRKPSRSRTRTRLDEIVLQAVREATPLRPEVPIRVARLEEAPVDGDPLALQQLLLNLLDNALAVSPVGSEVRIALDRHDQHATVAITDSGPGIAPTDLTRIFDRFYSKKIAEHSRRGAGLGLAIARAITAEHDGDLTAHNEPGGGATFKLVLPLARANASCTPAPTIATNGTGS